ITAQIRRDSIPIAEITTYIELIPPGSRRGPFRIAPIAAVDDPGPDASERQLTTAFDAVDTIGLLAERTPHPITFAIPPGVLTLMADRAPDRLARFLDQIDGNDMAIVLPIEPFDPSSAAAVDFGEDFATRMDLGEQEIGRVLPGTPVTRDVWLVDDRMTAAGASLLRDGGVDLFVTPYDRYASWLSASSIPMDPRFTDPTLLIGAEIDRNDDTRTIVDLAIVDPILDLVSPDPGGRPALERAVEIMTLTSASRLELGPDLRSMVLATPDLGVPDPAVVEALARLTSSHPEYSWQDAARVDGSTNSFFVGGVEFVVDLDTRPSQSLTERVAVVEGTRFAAADVASMLPSDDARPDAWRSELRIALSTAVSDASAEERLESIAADLDEIRGWLRQPEPFAFTLVDTESAIPLRIENTGPVPLTIGVRAEAAQLSFPEGEVLRVLEANTTTDIDIPVVVRSNGVFPVEVEFMTPAGGPILSPISLTARVNSLTGLGRVVTVGALLVLLTWWFSYFHRRRRAVVLASRERHPANVDVAPPDPTDVAG
ncbi:MAG: hypothetical protein RLZZ01_1376, partial [Actinomycetota bacterium]